MGCDQTKWVLCRALSNFSFVFYLWKHSESFLLLKTSSKSDLRFQRYRQFCIAENNKIKKEFHTIIGCISKSIFPTYDSFRLIASHIHCSSFKSACSNPQPHPLIFFFTHIEILVPEIESYLQGLFIYMFEVACAKSV